MPKIIFFAIGVFVVSFGLWFAFGFLIPKSVPCTLEIKICPDGSSVSRVPPRCDFAPCPKSKVIKLYYYNPELDKDEEGNIKCSSNGLVAIEKKIPISAKIIEDTINLLLKGKENLSEEEIQRGITTEYPLADFSLSQIHLGENGILTLKFNDPQKKSSGGACRVRILWFQIEETAKQFPQVKKVQFLPEDLFQP
ncbi:MAG: GerMN domain-containing protein [Minisyncoccales bacterium]